MTTNMQTIPFHGDELIYVERDGVPYVAVKPICERLGLAWQPQHRKLSDPQNDWTIYLMVTVGASEDGKNREMTCLSLFDFPLWLASISPSRISDDIREAFLIYRRECKAVLFEHFFTRKRSAEEQLHRLTQHLLAAKPAWSKVYFLQKAGVHRWLVWRHLRRPEEEVDALIAEMEASGAIAPDGWRENLWNPEENIWENEPWPRQSGAAIGSAGNA